MIKRLIIMLAIIPIDIISNIYFVLFEEFSSMESVDFIMGFLLIVREDLIEWSTRRD